MTAELRKEFIERLGTGTGPTRYRQLGELCLIAGINADNTRAITSVTIETLKTLGEDEWIDAFRQYRQKTKGTPVRLSVHGLKQIQDVVADFTSNK